MKLKEFWIQTEDIGPWEVSSEFLKSYPKENQIHVREISHELDSAYAHMVDLMERISNETTDGLHEVNYRVSFGRVKFWAKEALVRLRKARGD